MTTSNNSKPKEAGLSGPAIIALTHWLAQIGVTPITGWRWRKSGWLKTINICGRVYVTQAAIDDFMRRAEAGEFAKEHHVPNKGKNRGAR